MFSISSQNGYCGAHRAAFLDEMVKLVPKDIAEFGKRLDKISEISDGEMVMTFQDGSTATADAIIGCDGIKSRVRQLIIGEHHPSAYPTYTHKYAYRGLIPMEKAVEVVGEERAQNATLRVSSCPNCRLARQMLTVLPSDGPRRLYIDLSCQSRQHCQSCHLPYRRQ